jgi:hypothetical protein
MRVDTGGNAATRWAATRLFCTVDCTGISIRKEKRLDRGIATPSILNRGALLSITNPSSLIFIARHQLRVKDSKNFSNEEPNFTRRPLIGITRGTLAKAALISKTSPFYFNFAFFMFTPS